MPNNTLDDAVDQLEAKNPTVKGQPQKKGTTLDDAASDLIKKKSGGTSSSNGANPPVPTTTPSISPSRGVDYSNGFNKAFVEPIQQKELTPDELATKQLQSYTQEKQELHNSILSYNKQFGTNYNPDEVLSTAQKTSDFLQQVKGGLTKLSNQ